MIKSKWGISSFKYLYILQSLKYMLFRQTAEIRIVRDQLFVGF